MQKAFSLNIFIVQLSLNLISAFSGLLRSVGCSFLEYSCCCDLMLMWYLMLVKVGGKSLLACFYLIWGAGFFSWFVLGHEVPAKGRDKTRLGVRNAMYFIGFEHYLQL